MLRHGDEASSIELIKCSFIAASQWTKVSNKPCIKIGLGLRKAMRMRMVVTQASLWTQASLCKVRGRATLSLVVRKLHLPMGQIRVYVEGMPCAFEDIGTLQKSIQFCPHVCMCSPYKDAQRAPHELALDGRGCQPYAESHFGHLQRSLSFSTRSLAICNNALANLLEDPAQHDRCNIFDASSSKPAKSQKQHPCGSKSVLISHV